MIGSTVTSPWRRRGSVVLPFLLIPFKIWQDLTTTGGWTAPSPSPAKLRKGIIHSSYETQPIITVCWITQAQYHQLISSQIRRVWKKQLLVQCTGDPRTSLTGTLQARSVYQLLCSCSSSGLFHTNSFCECVIINYNYSTAHKSSLIHISLNYGTTSLTNPFGL